VSSRRKQKQERKRARKFRSQVRQLQPGEELQLPPEVGGSIRADPPPDPGPVELPTCARCAARFDLSQGEGVEYGEGDGSGHKSGMYFCSACFIEITP